MDIKRVEKKHTSGKIKSQLPDISVSDACRAFKVSRWTLCRMAKANNIQGQVTGRQTFFHRIELEKIFKPVMFNTVKLQLKCKGFIKSEEFRSSDLEGQEEWLKKNKNRFEYNQARFKAKPNKYTDWGKLEYSSQRN